MNENKPKKSSRKIFDAKIEEIGAGDENCSIKVSIGGGLPDLMSYRAMILILKTIARQTGITTQQAIKNLTEQIKWSESE